jgi:adenine-specific DNA-methyltransferase
LVLLEPWRLSICRSLRDSTADIGVNYGCPDMGWRYNPDTMARLISEGRILWPQNNDGRPRRKSFVDELESDFTGFSTIVGEGIFTRNGTADTLALFGERVFSFPKPVDLMKILVQQGTEADDIVLDFFAGSATTAHSVLAQNADDGGNRKFLLVQLPEELDVENRDQGTAAKFCDKIEKPRNIAELAKERIRRAGQLVIDDEYHGSWNKDVGFRVLKIDTSSMADVYYTPGEVKQDDLLGAVDNIKPGRDNPEDLLFQVLLDWGVDLTLPIRKEEIQGKGVFFVNKVPYDLIACFDTDITEELAKFEPMRVVFRDNGFVSDSVKINVDQIFRQLSPATDVKSI